METCSMCSRAIESSEPAFLMEESPICSKCEKQLAVFSSSYDPGEMKSASAYLFNCSERPSTRREVSEYLLNLLQDNEAYVSDIVAKAKSKTEKARHSAPSSFSYAAQKNANESSASSIWIKGMRLIAWVLFAAIVIAGVVIGFAAGEAWIGFLIVLGSVIGAFVSVAFIMIFLEMAENIKEIRDNTQKK